MFCWASQSLCTTLCADKLPPLLQSIKDVIGVHTDIPAPGLLTASCRCASWLFCFFVSPHHPYMLCAADMNTDGKVMGWIFDEYSKFAGFSPGEALSSMQPAT